MRPEKKPASPRSGLPGFFQELVLLLDRVRETVISGRFVHPERARLLAYYDGELSPFQSRRIEHHLAHCSECRLKCELENWQIERLLATNRNVPVEAGMPQRDEFQDLLRSMRSSPVLVTRSLLALLVGRKATANEGTASPANRLVRPLTAIILVATAIHVALGLIVWSGWQVLGAVQSLREFFNTAGDLFLVELAAAAFYLVLQVLRGYAADEPLHRGWFLISTAFGCDLVGLIFSKVLASHSDGLLPYTYGPILYEFGQFLAGPLRFSILACGLASVLKAYYRAGILTFRLGALEYVMLGCLAAYTAYENIQGAVFRNAHGLWTMQSVIESLNDPLLLMVLIATLLLRRSLQHLGGRRLTRCWTAMATAVGLIFLGNITTWAWSYNYLPLTITSIGWNLWFLAGASFPLACSFQLQAMGRTAEWVDTRRTGEASSEIAS